MDVGVGVGVHIRTYLHTVCDWVYVWVCVCGFVGYVVCVQLCERVSVDM